MVCFSLSLGITRIWQGHSHDLFREVASCSLFSFKFLTIHLHSECFCALAFYAIQDSKLSPFNEFIFIPLRLIVWLCTAGKGVGKAGRDSDPLL